MKKRKKKGLALSLSLSLLLGMTGCAAQAGKTSESPVVTEQATTAVSDSYMVSESSAAAEQTAVFIPGSYTVTVSGHNCDFDVTVIFDEERVTDIQIGENTESSYLGTITMERVRDDILAYQTPNVDTIAGATVSTAALVYAVKQAYTQAGAAPGDFPAPEKEAVIYDDTATQVVVVGSGTAGLAAAAEAAQQGLQVILLEQLGVLGGSSVRAGYLLGGSSEAQARAEIGEAYDKDAFVSYLSFSESSEVNPALYNEALSERIGRTAGENLDWLEQMGLSFVVSGFQHYGTSASGGLARVGSGFVSGLEKELYELGADIRLNTRADSLITENGSVVGVNVTAADGSVYQIKADAVILCTGGFTANPEMIAQYIPERAGYATDACLGADGSGIRMAESVGAELICMDEANYHTFSLVWRGVSRTLSQMIGYGAIAVNADGERFCNEGNYYYKSCLDTVAQQPEGRSFLIMNQAIIDQGCVPVTANIANQLSMYTRGDTIEELADALGIDPEGLAQTLSDYTAAVAAGVDEEFGRNASTLTASFAEGPFYGVESTSNLHTSYGGVRTDDSARALNEAGEAIPGLYVAGECAASPIQGNSTNTVCLAMGRIAAQTIAETILP